jgi:hypothetical protein
MLLVTPEAFARTYAPKGYADAWDCVGDYWRVMDEAAKHPSLKSHALSQRTDLPRGRVRSWTDDGSRPDVIRGLDVAEELGWFAESFHDPTIRALNVLVAGVFSGGSIATETRAVSFTIDGEETEQIRSALRTAGLNTRESHEESESRATELLPRKHGTVLGRYLSAAGAPVGEKNARADLHLPAYLDRAPLTIKADFVSIYVANRGVEHVGKATTPLLEQRSPAFRQELAELIADVSGERVTAGESSVILSADASRALGIRE